ncbi:MAG: RNA methyltransferase, partial [Proteobacteria bacterium]|nr:RNA methyltransferase [Pseudomonadota bacterium]
DGRGKVARATLLSDDEGVAVLSIDEPSRLAAPAHAAHLLIGIPKGPAMDLAIRMATEAGATHIHPVLLQRSVAKGDRHDRWARIARSAAQQCGRGDIPELLPLAKLEEAATRLPEDVGRYVAHPGGEAASSATGAFALLIGPEGGLTDDELRRSEALGFERLGLGPWIFRAETACAVGIAALTAESSP